MTPAPAGAKVSVKALAEFVHRRGDIHYRYQSATLAQEGISRQAAWQKGKGEGYQRERRVTACFGELDKAGQLGQLEVRGRIDGFDANAGVVEEVKTTRADADALHAHMGDVHLAQVRLYGAMLALEQDAVAELELRVVYLHPENPAETTFAEQWRREDLIAYFDATCGVYAAYLTAVRARLATRALQLRDMPFPYAEFRPQQRRLAKHLYRGFRDGVDWLVEAPTGAGKTMTSVFPALKAIGEGELDRLVFLTSRTTGQRAAEDALARAATAAGDETLVAVTVTAKERICFTPGAPCDPDRCEFARGYYERMPAARRALLERGLAVRDVVEAVAREHRVCPFELSLDATEWADVVVGDYNYVFDPVVRLTRLENALFARVGLVVDEAHHLGDRVRAMLSAALPRRMVKAALAEAGLPANAAKRFRSVDRTLAALGGGEAPRVIAKPEALCRAAERLVTAFATEAVDLEAFPVAAQAYWQTLRFGRATVWAEAEEGESAFRYLASGSGRGLCVQLACTAPGTHIRRTLTAFQGTVRQSGTLAPAPVFQRMHGFDVDAPALVSEAGWEPERLGVFAVADLSTYFRDRERSLPRLIATIDSVAAATPGNALVAFPSFDYLAAAAGQFASAADVRCQTADMALAERRDFIAWLNERRADRKRLGFVVMGGVFTESVDFDSEALRLVVVVGPGLPPRSLLRDLVAESATRTGTDGFDAAYRQPAMTRVAQAVGRIARAPGQRGVAVLVDPRFAQPAYRAFLPQRWRIASTPAAGAAAAVERFWAGAFRVRGLPGRP